MSLAVPTLLGTACFLLDYTMTRIIRFEINGKERDTNGNATTLDPCLGFTTPDGTSKANWNPSRSRTCECRRRGTISDVTA